MTDLRTAAKEALRAFQCHVESTWPTDRSTAAIAALRAALAQQDEPVEPVAWIQPDHLQKARVAPFLCRVEPTQRCADFAPLYLAPPQRKPQTLDETLQQPRAMAQAHEAGYKAGVAAEREACAKLCEARFMGDMTREDMEARRCAAAIRARGEQS